MNHGLIETSPIDFLEFICAILQIRSTRNSTCVKIGVHSLSDYFGRLILVYKLKSLVVESSSETYRDLAVRYIGNPNIRLLNAAVTHINGPTKFFEFSHRWERGRDLTAYSSVTKRHLALWKRKLCLTSKIVTRTVKGHNIYDLLAEHEVKHIALLCLDMAGGEDVAISDLLKSRIVPEIIYYNTRALLARQDDRLECLLEEKKYVTIRQGKWRISLRADTFRTVSDILGDNIRTESVVSYILRMRSKCQYN